MYFPTAVELEYENILMSILSKMKESNRQCRDFVDITLCNSRIENYLSSKGYKLREIRYEYIENNFAFGFYGRTSGNGTCLLRIIWGDEEYAMTEYGDFRK